MHPSLTIYSPQSFSAMESLRTARCACRQAESAYRSTHSSSDHSIFRSLRNQYHKLVLAAKRAYCSFVVKSLSDCPRRQWNTINNILHRKSSSLLPSPTHTPCPWLQYSPHHWHITRTLKTRLLQLTVLWSSKNPVNASPAYPEFSYSCRCCSSQVGPCAGPIMG